jgi:hypothetical protein
MWRPILGTCVALAALLWAGRSADAVASQDGGATRAAAAAQTQALKVTIYGPGVVSPGLSCTWYANVSNGTAPYTYHWSLAGMIEDYSTGASWTGHAAHSGQVGLDVFVTDANGQQGWGTLVIYGDVWAGPDC